MKKVFIILAIMLILSVLGGLLYFLFFSKKEQPTTASVEGVLLVYQTKSENIITDTETETRFVNNELLLTVNEDVTQEDVESFLAVQGGEIVGYDTFLRKYQILLKSEYTLAELEAIRTELAESDLFENVRVNLVFSVEADYAPNDSEWKNEWNKADGKAWGAIAIRAPEMWEFYREKDYPTINVGVIDNQFYTEHEDLKFADTFPNNYSFNAWGNTNNQDMDIGKNIKHGGHNHGTHVAGTIAATSDNKKGIAGIAPKVNLYGVSLVGLTNRGVKHNQNGVTVNELEAGLTYLICIKECKVINFSYSLGWVKAAAELSVALSIYIEHYEYDFVIVKSAGNGDSEGKPLNASGDALSLIENPTVKSRIIVVGAAKMPSDGNMRVANYSNYGSRVDLIAPGGSGGDGTDNNDGLGIYSTVYKNDYSYMSGTSMAAPHVSGVAAVMWSVNPNLTGADIKRIIVETATGSYGYENTSIKDKYKMLDGYEAVKAAANYSAPAQEPLTAINRDSFLPMIVSHNYYGAYLRDDGTAFIWTREGYLYSHHSYRIKDVVYVYADESNVYVIKSNGEIWAVNGFPDSQYHDTSYPVPTKVSENNNIDRIIRIQEEKKANYNENIEIKNGEVLVDEIKIQNLSDVVSIEGAVALKNDGTVWFMNTNDYDLDYSNAENSPWEEFDRIIGGNGITSDFPFVKAYSAVKIDGVDGIISISSTGVPYGVDGIRNDGIVWSLCPGGFGSGNLYSKEMFFNPKPHFIYIDLIAPYTDGLDMYYNLLDYTDKEIASFEYGDFDNNGVIEAFAVVGDINEYLELYMECELYFITQGNVNLLEGDLHGHSREPIDAGNYKFFLWEIHAGGSGSSTVVYGVKDGKPYENPLSKTLMMFGTLAEDGAFKGITHDFSQGWHDYIVHYYSFDDRKLEFNEIVGREHSEFGG